MLKRQPYYNHDPGETTLISDKPKWSFEIFHVAHVQFSNIQPNARNHTLILYPLYLTREHIAIPRDLWLILWFCGYTLFYRG